MPKYSREFNDKEKEYVFIRDGHKCQLCDLQLSGYWHMSQPSVKEPKLIFTIINGHIHHLLPISNGGSHIKSNWVLLCIHCHLSLHANNLVEWFRVSYIPTEVLQYAKG